MFSTPKIRLALHVVALSLPLVSARHAVAQKPPASFLTEELTRSGIGEVVGIDRQTASAAHVALDGHLVVTGTQTEVWVPAGKFVELLPKTNIVGFTPVTLSVFEDGQKTQTFGLEKAGTLPAIRIDPPIGAVNRKRVQIAVFDAARGVRTIMQCIVRGHIPAPTANLSLQMQGEQCCLSLSDSQTLSGGDLYMDAMYLGGVTATASKMSLDSRHLPPGTYQFKLLARTTDGVLLPQMDSALTVPPRYTLSCLNPADTIVVPEHAEATRLVVKVARLPGLSIVKTKIYIAGEFVTELAQENFDVALPLQEVPTGAATVDVVGVGADGVAYPVESLPIKIKNEPWEQRTYHTYEYTLIEEKLPKIAEQERLLAYWYERAVSEPSSTYTGSTTRTRQTTDSLGRTVTYTDIVDLYAPGHAAEYKANAKKALVEMAQLRLEAGRLYRKLHMKQHARGMLREVVREVGDMPSGAAAKAELLSLQQ